MDMGSGVLERGWGGLQRSLPNEDGEGGPCVEVWLEWECVEVCQEEEEAFLHWNVLSAIKARLVMYFVHFYMQVLGLTMGQEKH